MKTKYISVVIYGIFSVFLELSIAYALPISWYWKGTVIAGVGVVLSLVGRELIES